MGKDQTGLMGEVRRGPLPDDKSSSCEDGSDLRVLRDLRGKSFPASPGGSPGHGRLLSTLGGSGLHNPGRRNTRRISRFARLDIAARHPVHALHGVYIGRPYVADPISCRGGPHSGAVS